VQGVGKAFGNLTALEGVDLDVQPGEVHVLLGRNGAGKTTLLRILATTVRLDRGSARVGGFDATGQAAEVRARIGVLFGEDRGWYWRLTGRHNLEFFGILRGGRRDDVRQRNEDLLAAVELVEEASKPVGTMSSGMRARLGLARALLFDPPALLLDEPSSHLDPLAAAEFRDRVRAVAATGTAILMSTHDLHEAASVADRVTGLDRGRISFRLPRGATAPELEAALQRQETA